MNCQVSCWQGKTENRIIISDETWLHIFSSLKVKAYQTVDIQSGSHVPETSKQTIFGNKCKLSIEKWTRYYFIKYMSHKQDGAETEFDESSAYRCSTANRTTNRSQCQSVKQPHEQSQIAVCAWDSLAVVSSILQLVVSVAVDRRSITRQVIFTRHWLVQFVVTYLSCTILMIFQSLHQLL